MATSKAERHAIDAAMAVLSDEENRLGITHAGFAMTSLPHKRIEDGYWRREGHRTTLLVESGRNRHGELVGVPYGSIARLILLYLQTEAIRTNSPEVELGRSMNSWMGRMSLSTGGRTYQLVTEQARRISACRLTFFTERENGAETRHNGAFVQDAISLAGVSDAERAAVVAGPGAAGPRILALAAHHPVPVREEAIKAIGTRSLAIDVYIWLAYRLHALTKPAPVSWTAVHGQFGAGLSAGAADQADFPGSAQPGAGGLSRGTGGSRQGRAGAASLPAGGSAQRGEAARHRLRLDFTDATKSLHLQRCRHLCRGRPASVESKPRRHQRRA